MRRHFRRQPLIVIDNRGEVPKVLNKIEEDPYTENEDVPELKAGNGKAPLPYEVPPNSSLSRIYVPLIKNVISSREMRWKDGYDFNNITADPNWPEFVIAGIDKLKEKTGITSTGDWIVTAMRDTTTFFGIPYTILGDGLPFYARTISSVISEKLGWYKNPLFTITDSMTIIFSGLSWGYAFLLRLIDDRIQNSAGEDDPQAVCYSPTNHIIRTTCQGWYNMAVQDQLSKNIWANLCMRGKVDLFYDWNTLHSGDGFVWLVTNKEAYNEED